MRKYLTNLALLAWGLGVSVQAQAAESNTPIIIPIHNWSSQVVMAYVVGGIFESMGNKVTYVEADSQAVYEAVRKGDVTLSHEVWQSTFGQAFYDAMAQGGLIDAGTHAAPAMEEVGVPKWVIDRNMCPGLPHWEALKDCPEVFATPNTNGKGRWLEGPYSWHGDIMSSRIKALGLEDLYTTEHATGADAIWKEIAAAKQENRGIITFNWTPNFTDADGFVFIDFPPYFEGCRIADGGDGACGSPRGWLKKAAHEDFPKTHPRAYTAYTKISFTTRLIGQMSALVDVDNMSYKAAAQHWLDNNTAVWQPFTKD